MPDHTLSQLGSFTAKVGSISLRFVMLNDPRTPVWLALPDLLAAGRFPRALRRRLRVDAFSDTSGAHRIVDLQGYKTPIVPIDKARDLMMRATEENFCELYLADVLEVVVSYAWDELVNCNPSVPRNFFKALIVEGGE